MHKLEKLILESYAQLLTEMDGGQLFDYFNTKYVVDSHFHSDDSYIVKREPSGKDQYVIFDYDKDKDQFQIRQLGGYRIDQEEAMDLRMRLKDLEEEREDILRNMEQEAEPEGGPIADDYGSILNDIDAKIYKVKKLSTENNELYGSVKPTEISKLIQENDKVDVKPSMIQPINEIKALGKFKVKISLHSEVDAEIIIDVESAESIQ